MCQVTGVSGDHLLYFQLHTTAKWYVHFLYQLLPLLDFVCVHIGCSPCNTVYRGKPHARSGNTRYMTAPGMHDVVLCVVYCIMLVDVCVDMM